MSERWDEIPRLGGTVLAADIDGTLHPGNIFSTAVKSLIEQGLIENLPIEGAPYQDTTASRLRQYEQLFSGLHQDVVLQAIPDIRKLAMRRFAYVNHLLQACRKAGVIPVLVSLGPEVLVSAFGERLGIEHTFGSRLLTDQDQRLTGKVDVLNKAAACVEIVRNIGRISCAIGDGEADIAMLNLARKAVAVAHSTPFGDDLHRYRHMHPELDWDVITVERDGSEDTVWHCQELVVPRTLRDEGGYSCSQEQLQPHHVPELFGLAA